MGFGCGGLYGLGVGLNEVRVIVEKTGWTTVIIGKVALGKVEDRVSDRFYGKLHKIA